MHAQKDLKQHVLNDVQTDIGNDSHLTVANDSFMEVKNNQHIRINGECQLTVLKDDVDVAEANFYRKVTGEHQLTAKQEIHLRSGAKAILEAKQAITLKAGGNFITIDANGIQLMSQNVTFNEGGEAAIGTAFNGLRPVMGSRVLQSPLLKDVKALQSTAKAEGENHQKGSSNKDGQIVAIQEALILMRFNLGHYGADGDFGANTEKAVMTFQTLYSSTGNLHPDKADMTASGVVDTATLLAMDEALAEEWRYEILQSDALKSSLSLDSMAKSDGSVYSRNGDYSVEDTKLIQTALATLGFTCFVDGYFAGEVERAIKRFKRDYTPSNAVHASYDLSKNPNTGDFDKDMLLALDEALVENTLKYTEFDWSSSELGQLVFDKESSKEYDKYNKRLGNDKYEIVATDKITTWTVQQVLDALKDTKKMHAAGGFQVKYDTLAEAVKSLSLDKKATLFDKATQNRASCKTLN